MSSEIHYASSSRVKPLGSDDPIADAVGLLRPHSVVEPSLHAGGPWAVRFEPFPHVKMGGVVRGECRLVIDGNEPVVLREGDMYLLVNPPSHELTGRRTAEPQAAEPLWRGATGGAVQIGPAEEDTHLCLGYFRLDDTNASMLIDVLPRLVHVRTSDPRHRFLAHVKEMLSSEVESDALGGSLVMSHLAQILLVHMLRAHAEAGGCTGWLAALGDDGVGVALRAMHADVAHRWTLGELAGLSRMSRSAFAAAFKRQIGAAPMDYLIEWRMSLARDALRRNTRTISELTAATGYESESAFSTAFRRVVGSSPRHYRDAFRDAPG
ncbi:AraC family transcriptional regulator [Paractinoplanes lichenicola]|uniref:AraC family transcriptional regulator n=1 Tax=Paractinoplanes lichenicola TaxID=2802976 RepID=A0ABS1VU17_9ACTN|nr:AraC family transcriptional regulator [Actinoplanes lichenicola]MBL7257958.1 AraC family transcriptional regulator [Actinoplanes lichenicola]